MPSFIHDFQSFLDHGTYGEDLLPRTYERREHARPEHFAAYEANLLKMHEFRKLLVDFMDEHSLDALVYPLQSILVAEHGMPNAQRNGFLASMAMLPGLNVPAGYSQPTDTAPDGVPVGIDFVGRPFDEGRLLGFAFAWEQRGMDRRWPSTTPPLPGEEIGP